MKSSFVSFFAVLAATSLAGADATPPAPCCPPATAQPACCAETRSNAETAACCSAGKTATQPAAGCADAGTAAAKAACCAAGAPATAATVATAKPAAAPCCEELKVAAPLSNRSLYQLEAKWTNDADQTVALTSFRGRPVVLAMFFASCEYACPVLVDDLKRLRATLTPEVRDQTQIVLVSFDTVRDTPAALRAFRERMNLDSRWTLLRGADSAVQELAMLLGVKYKQDARGQFAHSNLFTVLNAGGESIHQHAGLMGDVSPAAKVVASLGR